MQLVGSNWSSFDARLEHADASLDDGCAEGWRTYSSSSSLSSLGKATSSSSSLRLFLEDMILGDDLNDLSASAVYMMRERERGLWMGIDCDGICG